MKHGKFLVSMADLVAGSDTVRIVADSRIAIVGDLRMGDGGPRDEAQPLSRLAESVLSGWYLARGHTLVLNGDTEDLRGFWLKDIRKAWEGMYRVFDEFHARSALRKILGERDLGLMRKRDFPYPLAHGLTLEGGGLRMFVTHGHQASCYFAHRDYAEFLADFADRPRRIRDEDDLSDGGRVHRAERRLHGASAGLGIATIASHTGRALFESRSSLENLRETVETFLRAEAGTDPANRDIASDLVRLYRKEFKRRRSSAKRLSELGADSGLPPPPCLFIPGRAANGRYFNAMEISEGTIRLVQWELTGREKSPAKGRAPKSDTIEGGKITRSILKESSLGSLRGRLDILAAMETDRTAESRRKTAFWMA